MTDEGLVSRTGGRGDASWHRRSWRRAGGACGRRLGRARRDRVRTFAARHFALPPARSLVLRNAIPVESFAAPDPGARAAVRAEFGLDPDVSLVGVIGRLIPVKGHDYLIRAIAKLRPRRPEVRLLIVGDGERAGALRQLVQQLGLTEVVLFAGQRDDVAGILAALDLVAMPSLGEGLPLACLEAIASGTPVVGFDAPALASPSPAPSRRSCGNPRAGASPASTSRSSPGA